MKTVIKLAASKGMILGAAIWMVQPMPVHAQTVDECYAERDKLQRWIGEQENQDAFEHAQQLIERADLFGSEGNGKKCMELIREAKGAVNMPGRN